jgi:hypothetical protein
MKNILLFITYLFCIFVFLGFILYSVGNIVVLAFNYGFFFHNIDLSYNMCLVSNDLKEIEKSGNCTFETDYREFKDRYDLNETTSYTDSYINSFNAMRIDFIKFGYFGLLLGYSIFGLLSMSLTLLYEWSKEVNKHGEKKLSDENKIAENGKGNRRPAKHNCRSV